MGLNPKLLLSVEEKGKLRKAKVKIGDIHTLSTTQLIEILDIPLDNAREIYALAEFQIVPSIGYELSAKLVFRLNIFSLQEIRQKDGAALLDVLEKELGVWTDSCVEDQIRCVINFSNDPSSNKQWFDFTNERKKFREKFGYPADRHKKAWYEYRSYNENKVNPRKGEC